jgi:hypothetical protein
MKEPVESTADADFAVEASVAGGHKKNDESSGREKRAGT